VPEIEDVAASLSRWAAGRNAAVVDGPTPVRGGFDTYIYRFRLDDGPPLILRVYPSERRAASAEREAVVLRHLAAVGYPAPALVDASGDLAAFGLPYVVMEEVPGRNGLDQLRKRPRQVGPLVGSLAAAQASLHALDPETWPIAAEGSEIDRRFDALGDRSFTDPKLAAAVAWLRSNADTVRGEEPSVCHFDFHPLNVLVADDGRLTVIDWENAALGDRHSDLARTLVLFHAASAAANSSLERAVVRLARSSLVRSYRQAYARLLPIDEERLRYWMALHAADGWWEWGSLLDGTYDKASRTDERRAAAGRVAPAMAALFGRMVPEAAASPHYAP
jgi:aminoglycoside phosphotransferase (APT) family kinase protein